jgi:hypothetical protein
MLRASASADPAPTAAERERTRTEAREQIQTVSWYLLLDLAKYLQQHVPAAGAAILGTPGTLSAGERALVAAIAGTSYTRDGVRSALYTTLAAIAARESQLEAVTAPYVEGSAAWPSERFPLATVRSREELAPAAGVSPPSPVESLQGPLTPDALETLVAAALPAVATARLPEAPIAARPVMAPGDPGWFVIRCVYERPHCGPLSPPVVSDATEMFQLAGFFDPDAPARPIRIGLPVDISPAGLRKFDKNTAFMVSDMLCGHVTRMKGLTLGDLVLSVLPWPLHKDLPVADGGPCKEGGASLGMMCSLSLPIITLCALMLLMIIVALLDIVFRWIPFFLVCFPVPGLKGKEEA